jgi:hypothetical protein
MCVTIVDAPRGSLRFGSWSAPVRFIVKVESQHACTPVVRKIDGNHVVAGDETK